MENFAKWKRIVTEWWDHDPEKADVDPATDWLVLFAVAMALLVCITPALFYFRSVAYRLSRTVPEAASSSSAVSVREGGLNRAVKDLEVRQAERAELEADPPSLSDPGV